LNYVLDGLEQECERTGKQEFFDHARVFLTGEKGSPECASIAAELGMTEGTVRVAVHRLRRRYRELLRQEIANTTDDPNGIDEEIQTLFTALGS
jgi:RNA polymerase sigma-70 factor (ECF subfamily)